MDRRVHQTTGRVLTVHPPSTTTNSAEVVSKSIKEVTVPRIVVSSPDTQCGTVEGPGEGKCAGGFTRHHKNSTGEGGEVCEGATAGVPSLYQDTASNDKENSNLRDQDNELNSAGYHDVANTNCKDVTYCTYNLINHSQF